MTRHNLIPPDAGKGPLDELIETYNRLLTGKLQTAVAARGHLVILMIASEGIEVRRRDAPVTFLTLIPWKELDGADMLAVIDAALAPSPGVVIVDVVRTCRVCGCTDVDCSGCIERTGAPCWWVEPYLCSACRVPVEHDPRGRKHDEKYQFRLTPEQVDEVIARNDWQIDTVNDRAAVFFGGKWRMICRTDLVDDCCTYQLVSNMQPVVRENPMKYYRGKGCYGARVDDSIFAIIDHR